MIRKNPVIDFLISLLIPHAEEPSAKSDTHEEENKPERMKPALLQKSVVVMLFLIFVNSVTFAAVKTWLPAGAGSWATGANWSGGTVPANGDDIVINLTAAGIIDNVPTISLNSISIGGTASVRLTGTGATTITINNTNATSALSIVAGRTLTLGNGTAATAVRITFQTITTATTISGTLTNTVANTIIINSLQTLSIAGTFTANAGTITVNGTISNSGTVTGAAAALSFTANSSYIHARNAGTIPTATWNALSNCTISGIVANMPAGLGQTFGNFTWNSPAQTVNGNFSGIDTRTINGNFNLISTGTGSLQFVTAAVARSFSILKDFTISGGTLNLSAGTVTGTMNIAGNFSITNGTITESSTGSGAIVFNGTSVQNYTKSGGTFSNTINFSVNNNAILNMGTSVIDGSAGSFTLVNGGTLRTGHADGITTSPTLQGSIQATGGRTFNTGANYVYNGASAQVTGSGLPATVNNLTMANTVIAPAGVTLSQGVTVSTVLTMTSGNIITGGNTFSMSSPVETNLVYGSGTIIGTFTRQTGVTGVQYLFPVGTVSNYNPLKITFSNLTAGQLAVRYQPNDIGTAGLPLAGIFDRHTTGYWTLTASAPMASTNYDINLNYTGFSGVDANARIIKRTDGGNLTLDGAHGAVINPEISRTGLNGISTGTTDLAIGKANPVITSQPFPYSGCNATFSVLVSGLAPLTYQWQEDNGGGFADITDGGIYSGATTSSLSITGATVVMNGYLYQCVITDPLLYTITSNSAMLTVNPPPVVTLGYSYSRDITLNAASGPSDLTDFPALVSITTVPELRTIPNGGNLNNANGYDIVFTDQSGNKLDHQIESYDALTGQYIAWVRIPLLSNSTTTTIKMLYGNATVSTNPSLKSVWASNYKGVWHLNGTDYTDATLTGNNGTENATSNVTGIIAGGRLFDGATSFISVPTTGFVPNNNNQTISIWANYAVTPGGDRNLISFQGGGSAIQVGFRGGNAVVWKWGGALLADAGAAPSINVWHYYVYTYDGTTSRIYIDGIELNNSTVAPQTLTPTEGNIGRYNNGEYVNASLDEPRFSMSPKSAGWILTEYNNQNAPGGFITVGAENANLELASVGACSTTFLLDHGTPSGGIYSGTGVVGTNFNASVAGVGTHIITYTYTDVSGCSNSSVKNIIVTSVPSAPAAANKECCVSNIVDLEATGINLKWYSDAGLTTQVGTGTPFATGRTSAGVYTYYVTQTQNGCESTATTVSLSVFSGITIDTQPQPFSLCASGNAIFTVAASGYNLTYQWQEDNGGGFTNLSDGGVYSGVLTSSLTLTGPGIGQDGYLYRCVISSACGASPVNTNTALLTFKPIPTPSISGNINACPFETGVTYSTPFVSGNTYSWIVTGGTINGSSTSDIVVVDWGGSGTGTVTVTESVNLSCSTTTPAYNVSISDVIAPTVSGCPSNISINNDAGVCTAIVSWTEPTATDDCLGAMTFTTRSHAPGDVFPLGTTTVTYTFEDLAGNASICNFNVTVTDITAPVITGCPANINANNVPGACATIVSWTEPAATDNCTVAGSLVWTKSHLPGDLFPVGVTVVTYTAKDAADNTATCTFNVTVTDNQAPNAICRDISVFRDALGNATITPAQVDNGSTDNCSIATLSLSQSSFTISDASPQTVTLTVTDMQGNSSTCNSTVTLLGTLPPTAYYSYISGDWNQISTWTTDPGGTTGPGTSVPGNNDKVVILSGRTVTLTADVAAQNIDLTINNGGILDLSTYAFTDVAGLAALKGGGVLKLSSSNFPAATVNTFVTTDAGTAEYNNNGSMSATQGTYYHLIVRTAGTVTQVNNINLNGNLDVKQGIFSINDATARRLQLIINGDVTVDNACSVSVGTGVTNTTTVPTGITGTTNGFVDYYELHSHRVQVYGNFTNNGTVKFTNLAYPVYNSFPPTVNGATTGFATVYFQGPADKSLTCNGTTDFYNLVLDKGNSQTFKLTINSAAYNNFRLFGANTSVFDITAPATTNANPNLKKALWIKNGTLELQGLTVIPSLSEGATAGPPSSDFFIPANGALLMNGTGVIVLSTADDYREVNGAYGVVAPNNASMGIVSTANSGLSVLGKLQINDGYLSTRESTGLLYWDYAPGQFILNGGTVDTKQLHSSSAANSLISYTQTGGTLLLRGRFQRTTTVFTPAGIITAPLNNIRAANGVTTTQGSFNITNSGGVNGFAMSSGNIRIYDVCGTVAPTYAFQVLCAPSGINVSGGTVEIIPTTGTVPANDADYLINTTAPFWDLIINRASGVRAAILNTNAITVLHNLSLTSGVLTANNLNISIGGDFSIATGTTYTPGTNTTIFNGSANQTLTVDLAAPLGLNKLTIDKTAGLALNLAGSQSTINVLSDFRLALGTLNDAGKTVSISGNVYNSGIHSGAGKIVLNGTLPQSIDGNGVFANLELNNTNAAAAPVSLLANITLNGVLTLSQDKLFNINTYNLLLNSAAFIVNGGPLRYIKSAGNTGDGGLTKVYSSPATFNFPVGVINYTPASLGLSAAPSVYGSVTLVPVNFEHPNVTATGRSLTYFWRVKSSGFTLGTATVTHSYTYATANVITGGDVTEDGYVPARFDVSASTWSNGPDTDVDETNNIIGGSFLTNESFIDGDYTAGDNIGTDPFGAPQVIYSRQSGLWSDVNTWSLSGHSGAADAPVPGASDIVIIGGADSVYLATNLLIADTDVRSCASLKIEIGSALDIGYNPGCVFGMVVNHTSGNGNFRLTTSFTDGSVYVFPSGDFSDFNVNRGTTEFYTTNPAVGPIFILPPNVNSYGTVILSPLGGSNLALPNTNSVTIYGDLICRGQNWESWLAMTWDGAYGAIVAKTVNVRGDLLLQGGSFVFAFNGAIAQNLIIDGDVVVNPSAGMDLWSTTNNTISIGGNFINNSDNSGPAIYGGWAGSNVRLRRANGNVCNVIFFGPNSASITNDPVISANPSTTFNNVTVNKGSSQATTLTLDIGGTLSTLTNNWLNLQNGTLRYMRSNPNSDFTISTTTAFSIPATAGLTINLPSNSGNRNILIGNAASNTGDLLLSGKLTLINGNVYIGSTTGADVSNNDIEYTSSGASAIDMQGGNLFVNGQIRRNPLNAGGILKYSQNGGTVTINGQASNNTNAKLEVLNGGSDFSMSNGTLNIVRGNGALISSSTPFGDLYLRPETSSVTGGTIIFSQGALPTENYFLDANIPLSNLTITGAAGQPATVRLLLSPLVLNGNMIINANSVFDANNINVTFNGNLINTPGIGGYLYGTNLTTFGSAGAQSIFGATNFYDLVVNSGTSLTIDNPSTVYRNLIISRGNFTIGTYPVSVRGDFTNNAGYLDTDAAGYGIILDGTSLQHISGTGYYSRLTLNNAAGAGIENNITLNEDLTLTLGILDIKQNLVSLGVNSFIEGAPFSATKMIASDGVFSNVGLRKFFNTVAAPTTFLYPIGTSGKYTPALLTIDNSNTVGYVRINNINSLHPSILDPTKALDYYWEVQSSGITGFDGELELNYYQEDVAGDESSYLSARIEVPGTAWDLTLPVDVPLNKITFEYTSSNNLSGEYTAGIPVAFFNNVPIFTSNANGNWTTPGIWTQTGGDPRILTGGPNGYIVIINHEVTLNASYCTAYRTTINGKLKVTSGFYGHNLGTVDGNGTLYLESGSFPAGVFTTFLSCANNATVEYGGSGVYTIIADLYDNISKIIFSGTGTRVLPNKDLTICNMLKIDGPILDNSVYNKKLIIQGTMERYNTGTFKRGSGAGATVSFAGSGPQDIGGALGDFTGTSAFNNFEINNSAGIHVNNAGAIEVGSDGNLLLTSGLINTGSGRSLTITNSDINCVVPAGGSLSSFVDGPLIKSISQFDNFLFPVGKSGTPNVLGNNIKLSSTQTGPLLWSAEYFTPNGTSASITSPLLGVSAQEFYTVIATAGNQAILNLNWTPSSDVTPLITGGLSNIRLANYNTGTSRWVEIPTTSAGNNSNGTATSTVLVTSTGSDNYTLGSITDLKPRAKLSPAGPVCGGAGIPVTFTAPYAIPFNYVLNYKINGTPQIPITITSLTPTPYIIPTPGIGAGPWVYELTDFTYNSGTLIGVVDAGTVTVYPVPDIADAGSPQTHCGITTATLAGNAPAIGTGQWSIISGAGGNIITPGSPTSQFIGLNGVAYNLRWTITSGTCTSTDDVAINFTISPVAPAAAANQSFCGVPTVADIIATPPVGCTIDWYSAATGGILFSPPTATNLVVGTTYYAESNGGAGCNSSTRTAVTVTAINPSPNPGLAGTNSVCIGSTGNVYSTEPGMSNYVWNVVGGFITSALGTNTVTVTWNVSGSQSISVNYQNAFGCAAATPTLYNVTVSNNPTITLGAFPVVCSGITSADLLYSATTGSPDQYSIDYSAAAEAVGFIDLSNIVLPASPVSLFVPGGAAAGTYPGTLTVSNSGTGCVSGLYAISVTVDATPSPATVGATQNLCGTLISGALGGNVPVVGTGAWSQFSGPGTTVFSAPGLGSSTATASVYGTYVYEWTISNGTCAPSTAQVTVIFSQNPVPSFTVEPGASACLGNDVTYTTESGQLSYVWTLPGTLGIDYSITSGGIGAADNTVTLKWLTIGVKLVTINYSNIAGCTGLTATSSISTMVSITLPVSVSITADANPVCAGTSVLFTATQVNGGITPFYQWYNGAVQVGTDNPTYSYIPTNGDVITVVLTSSEPCQSGSPATSNSITMTVNPVVPVSVSITTDANPVCTGTSVLFTATPVNEGLTPTYQWYNGAAPVGAGGTTYSYIPTNGDVITVVLTSSEPCQSGSPATSNLVTMTINPTPAVTITNPAAVCSPSTVDLTATAVTSGSTAGLIYTYWTDAAATSACTTETAATAGIYYIKGTDPITGCFDIQPVIVTVNPTPTVIITNPAAVCSPSTIDLTATAVIAGSTAGLTYTYWTDAAATIVYATPAAATTGTYYIKGTNGSGCFDIKPVAVLVSSAPSATVTSANVLCTGTSSGAIDITVSGGTPVYIYLWSNGAVSEDLTGVPAGVYTVLITDAGGCTAASGATITEPATALSGAVTTQTNVTTFSGNDGSVTIDGSGGVSPYLYKIGSGVYQATGTFSSLIAGSYTVTVQDANLCTSDVAVTITQPAVVLSGSIMSQINVVCFGSSTGSVTVSGTGGIAPYDYKLNTGTYQVSGTFDTLTAGPYTITVRDASLNTFDVNVTITQTASAVGGFILDQTNVLCSGSSTGNLTVGGSGGLAPYLYKLGSGSYQVSGTFGTLTAGNYIVTVQDANLCTFDVLITISQPASTLTGSIIARTAVSCFGSANGSVTVTGIGGTSPYEYSFNGGIYQTSGIFNGLAAATYTITVRDANLCTVNISAIITEPAALSLSSTTTDASCPDVPDGDITLTVTGGTLPYTAIWADGVLTTNRLNVPDGTYSVVVTDLNSCAASLDIVVGVVGSESCIEVQEVITPNNDGFNDTWKIKNIDLFPNAEVNVFSRWGKRVFSTKNIPANEWDGTFKGKLLPTDSYHYILHLNDGSQPRSGVISIIR